MDETLELRKQALNNLYLSALVNGMCKTKKEFAALIDRDYGVVVSAMNGQERNCTENLLRHARMTLGELEKEQELQKQEQNTPKEETPAAKSPEAVSESATLEDLLVELKLQTELLKSIKNSISEISLR